MTLISKELINSCLNCRNVTITIIQNVIYLQVCTRGVTAVPGGHQVRWGIFSSCYNEMRQEEMTSTMFLLILKVRSIAPD